MKSLINEDTGASPVLQKGITLLLFSLALLLLFSLGFIRNPLSSQQYYGHHIDVPAPAFELADLQGRQWRLEDFQGQYVFLMFGYLNCTETCHAQALVMNSLRQNIPDDAVRFVYISMDPVRDTVARLKNYFPSADKRLTVLRGENIKHLQAVANLYKAPFSMSGGADFEISHPGYIFLIDPHGQLAMIYASGIVDADRMYDDLLQYKTHLSRGGKNVG